MAVRRTTQSLVLSMALTAPVLAAGVPKGIRPPPDPPRRFAAIAVGTPVLFSGLGGAPQGRFFLLGAGDLYNNGALPPSAWLVNMGDLDHDGQPEYRLTLPQGSGILNDPAHPPLVLLLYAAAEDLDHDGVFDVFEDNNHDGIIDGMEVDRDSDGRATPPFGCEGLRREDKDCDGHLDIINEDSNHNGRLDPGEDLDGDGRLDLGTEDRNHDLRLNDRPDPWNNNGLIPDENGNLFNFYP